MRPVASRSLFLDVQVLTVLLGQVTLFAHAISTTPLTLSSKFSTIFVAHLRLYTSTTGCKRGLQEDFGSMVVTTLYGLAY